MKNKKWSICWRQCILDKILCPSYFRFVASKQVAIMLYDIIKGTYDESIKHSKIVKSSKSPGAHSSLSLNSLEIGIIADTCGIYTNNGKLGLFIIYFVYNVWKSHSVVEKREDRMKIFHFFQIESTEIYLCHNSNSCCDFPSSFVPFLFEFQIFLFENKTFF